MNWKNILWKEKYREEQERRYYEAINAYQRGDRNEEGFLKHICCEGARFHVLKWTLDSDGYAHTICSESECEINEEDRRRKKRYLERKRFKFPRK